MSASPSSRTCTNCQLPFPLQAEYERCPVCDRTTTVLLTTPLPDDWERRLSVAFEAWADSSEETDRVIANRARRLLDAGYEWPEAARLAARFQGEGKVDVQEIEQLLAKGATHSQAAKIAS